MVSVRRCGSGDSPTTYTHTYRDYFNIWGVFRVDNWSTSDTTIKIVISDDVCPILSPKFSERGSNVLSLSGVLVQKQAFQKGDGSHLFSFFVVVVVGGC